MQVKGQRQHDDDVDDDDDELLLHPENIFPTAGLLHQQFSLVDLHFPAELSKQLPLLQVKESLQQFVGNEVKEKQHQKYIYL